MDSNPKQTNGASASNGNSRAPAARSGDNRNSRNSGGRNNNNRNGGGNRNGGRNNNRSGGAGRASRGAAIRASRNNHSMAEKLIDIHNVHEVSAQDRANIVPLDEKATLRWVSLGG